MLNKESDIVIVDFGISVHYKESDVLSGKTMGTVKYYAPEIVRTGVKNKVIHGLKTDVWAAGITLYQIASGKHPFPATC
jgi:serine/threonine protein kinase